MTKVAIKVLPRPEVLDSQGRAVEETLKRQGYQVGACQMGRYMVLEFPELADGEALERAKEIAKEALHNPLIEVFEAEVL